MLIELLLCTEKSMESLFAFVFVFLKQLSPKPKQHVSHTFLLGDSVFSLSLGQLRLVLNLCGVCVSVSVVIPCLGAPKAQIYSLCVRHAIKMCT